MLSVIALIIITGGIESWFSFILILITIAGSIVLSRRTGYVLATVGGILYGLTLDLQYYQVIPIYFNPVFEATDFFYNVFINITGLYLTAYLMGYLVSRLQETSESLEKADLDLRELSRFHSEVIENIPSGLFTTDTSGKITYLNRSGERITGLTRSEANALLISDIFPFLSLPLRLGRHEGEVMRKGEMRSVGMNISVNQSSDSISLGYIGTFQDLTTIIQMEEEMKRKEKLAAIGELSASIAHELRNPLASLKGSLEMLKENRLPAQTKTRLMDIAITEMDRLNSTVTDFLLYCNPKPPELKRIALSDVVNEVADMIQNMSEKVMITRDIKKGLLVVADKQKIRQLIWNLGCNAVESIDSKSGEVFISLHADDENVTLSVRDNGVGIPEENLEKIFYPFFSTKREGTGLGLSIAYRIVEEHQGHIKVSSERNKGTEFVVSLLSIEKAPHDASGDI
jgi:two-component system sensor histidine kinase PilS (NtrC family)